MKTYIILLSLGSLIFTACVNTRADNQTAPEQEVIAVKTARGQWSENSVNLTATGLITTENETRYSFITAGIIDKIFIREGQSFQKGQLLARLKLTEIEAAVAQARLAHEKSLRDYGRISNLYADSVATLEQIQNAQTALEVAEKQLEAALFGMQYASIYARSDGFVTARLASEGEVIPAGYPVLVINENGADASWVLRAGLSDKGWASVQQGDEAEISIPAFPDMTFRGVVSKKVQAADQRSGSFQIEIQFDPRDVNPAVGMYARADIQLQRTNRLLTIPYDAVIEANGSKAFVFVPHQDTRVKKKPVTIHSFTNEGVMILSGLDELDQFVISNSAFLNENSIIAIVK
jgi:RND family efflux transporter MFP subunit